MYCGLFQDPDVIGERAFAVEAPVLWNSLPVDIRSAESVSVFKSLEATKISLLSKNLFV